MIRADAEGGRSADDVEQGWLRPWSLRRRVTVLLVSVAVLLVALVATITVSALSARDAMMRQSEQLNPAKSAVQEVLGAYLSQESAVRGYTVTEEEEFLGTYSEGRVTLEETMPVLRDLAGDNEDIDADVRALLVAGEAWHRDFAEPTIEAVRDGDQVSVESSRLGRERFTELRAAAASAENRIDTELAVAETGLTTATQQLIALLGLVGVVVVVLSVFLWVMLQHWVLRPLDELGRHLQQVSDGFYAHRIELFAPPEIHRVGRDVDAMRERIVRDLDEVAVARRTLQEQSELLERQAEELRRSNLELEQFAYVASHDLQEPLRKVASFCQLLQRRYQGQLDDRADSYIGFAVEGAKRMQTLINDLLAFSRVGRTKNFSTVDLNTAFTDAMSSLEKRLEEAEAVVTSDDLPTIEGDRTLLTQVIFNLIGNAVKFRGDDPPKVHIGVTREGDDWVFCCADNGIGIEQQYADRIFVIFQRLHTRDKYGGTGIGLAMCKKIVEFHGGRIWLDEPDGAGADERSGTRICWSLPVEADTNEPPDVLAEIDAGVSEPSAAADPAEQRV